MCFFLYIYQWFGHFCRESAKRVWKISHSILHLKYFSSYIWMFIFGYTHPERKFSVHFCTWIMSNMKIILIIKLFDSSPDKLIHPHLYDKIHIIFTCTLEWAARVHITTQLFAAWQCFFTDFPNSRQLNFVFFTILFLVQLEFVLVASTSLSAHFFFASLMLSTLFVWFNAVWISGSSLN